MRIHGSNTGLLSLRRTGMGKMGEFLKKSV